MATGLPIYEAPNEKVFGVVGDVVTSTEGKAYVKKSDDTTNIGWEEFLEPTPFEFEEISLTSVTRFGPASITGSTNAPTLYFDLPSGSADISVEVFVNTPNYEFLSVAPLWVQVDNFTPKTATSGSTFYFEQKNLGPGVHFVRASCSIDSGVSITIIVKKIGGYGSQFKNARGYGRIGQGAEMILQVYNTDQFSRGKFVFVDAVKGNFPTSSDSVYSFDTNGLSNNLSAFYGGGQINSRATILTGESSIGYIQILDFYDGLNSIDEIVNFSPDGVLPSIPVKLFVPPQLFWLETPGENIVIRTYEATT